MKVSQTEGQQTHPESAPNNRKRDMTKITASEAIQTGDVIELELNGLDTTAVVLLASEFAVIVDLNDGSMPLVIQLDELVNVRVFSPLALAA